MDDAGIYWTSYVSYAAPSSAASRVDRDGRNRRDLMQGKGMPEEILAYEGSVYWQTYGNDYMTSFFAIATDGGGQQTLASGLASGLFPWAALGDDLYWAATMIPLTISRMSLDGGPSSVVATSFTPAAMTADDASLYFTNDNAVYAMPSDGGAPIGVAWKLPQPYAIAVAGDSLYWTDLGTCDAHACTGAILKLTPK
jgi:hypothetical protein